MPKIWRTVEWVVIHVVATIVIVFALAISIGIVKAEPRCHQHATVTHCH